MMQILQKVVLTKHAKFVSKNFGENIIKPITSVPGVKF
jgi:hypothetical protein